MVYNEESKSHWPDSGKKEEKSTKEDVGTTWNNGKSKWNRHSSNGKGRPFLIKISIVVRMELGNNATKLR